MIIKLGHHTIIHDSHPYSSGFWLRDDIYDWLVIHVGDGAQDGSRDGDWRWLFNRGISGSPVNNLIRLPSRADALRFTLAWGAG